MLASEEVLYVGHPVAAVAAISPHVAEEAAKLIKVEYEILPAVTDVRAALKLNAPHYDEHMITSPSKSSKQSRSHY